MNKVQLFLPQSKDVIGPLFAAVMEDARNVMGDAGGYLQTLGTGFVRDEYGYSIETPIFILTYWCDEDKFGGFIKSMDKLCVRILTATGWPTIAVEVYGEMMVVSKDSSLAEQVNAQFGTRV